MAKLRSVLGDLKTDGYGQIMVFTQYTDTMDFLREHLSRNPDLRLMCYSGRGGELRSADGTWRVISRDDAKRRFRERQADILLCTDAAAEGLNFQFCGALVNYDMPWNPLRVEQRGRIDRLGQENPIIRIANLTTMKQSKLTSIASCAPGLGFSRGLLESSNQFCRKYQAGFPEPY